MAKQTILVVEDERDIRDLLEHHLSQEGFGVAAAGDGDSAVRRVREEPPDLVLLDLMLPGLCGIDVCRRLRQQEEYRKIPIIMLTARDTEADIIRGLEMGADDYITKPFSPMEVVARVRAVLRRRRESTPDEDADLRFGSLMIQSGKHEVTVEGKTVPLTRTEFQILHRLAARPGWVFTRYQLVDAVHGEQHAVSDRSIDVHVAGLRKHLGSCGHLIETVRGIGYRFKDVRNE